MYDFYDLADTLIAWMSRKVTETEAKTLYTLCFKRLQEDNIIEPLPVPPIVRSSIASTYDDTYLRGDEIFSRECETLPTITGIYNGLSKEKSYDVTLVDSKGRRLIYDKQTKTGYVIGKTHKQVILKYKDKVFTSYVAGIDRHEDQRIFYLICATDYEI